MAASYEGWLQLSIDHVVPQQAQRLGFPAEWILGATNIVTCCRPCNDLFNRDPGPDPVPPPTLESFYDLRDRMFLARRDRILTRREMERAWFVAQILGSH